MRILFVARSGTAPLHWGDRLLLYHVTRTLAARGHTLDLLGFEPPATLADGLANADHFRRARLFPDAAVSRAAQLRRALLPGGRFPATADAAWSPEMWRQIAAWGSDGGCDLVHVFGGIRVYEYRAAFAQLPAIIQPYDSYTLIMARRLAHSAHPLHAVEWAVSRQYERFMYAPYQRVVFVADPDADYVRRLRPDLPITVIPNGVDSDYFAPGAARRDPHTLVLTGNFSYAPNVAAALTLVHEVLPQVRAVFPTARVILAGAEPPPSLTALAADPAVSVTGHVSDLRPYLAQAAAFVCPMTQGAGIKNKLLEALSMACPVIATPESAAGIALTDGVHARVVPIAALAEAVIAALRDPARSAALGEAGRQWVVERYSWAASADHYETLYREVVASAGQSPASLP